MKKLFILSLMLPCLCFGQKDSSFYGLLISKAFKFDTTYKIPTTSDSLFIDYRDSGTYLKDFKISNYYSDSLYISVSRPDTVKCLMIVTDTSIRFNNKIVSLKGYWIENWSDKRTKYLDIIKQPLPKSIVVFMAIKIN